MSLFSVISLQYFGGTNFGRTAGGPLVATSYDYDAPIDEYGKFIQHLDFEKLVKQINFCCVAQKFRIVIQIS